MNSVSPVETGVFHALSKSILEEMGEALCHGAFSQNIKERRDYSCALFNSSCELIAGANHIPVHLGSMDTSCRAAIDNVRMNPGDAVVLNDPFSGGTHLPDITVIFPFFHDPNSAPSFYLGVRAHHSDVGGIAPGSLPLSKYLSEEGIIIKPVKIIEGGNIREDVLAEIRNASRQPEERNGDLRAQVASGATGLKRLTELASSRGIGRIINEADALLDHSEKILTSFLDSKPESKGTGVALMDSIPGEPGVKIHCEISLSNSKLKVDLSESSDQHPGCLNANEAITRSAVLYALRLFLPADTPSTSGLLRPVEILIRDGSVLKPSDGAAVAGGNVETSQAIVEALLKALGNIGWESAASSQSTMNNVLFGNGNFSFYETIGGGAGASDGCNGASGIQTHMTNTRSTPVESIEREYPLRIVRYMVRENSGGGGLFYGGNGVVREFEILEDCECTVLSNHREAGVEGMNGGGNGKAGKNLLVREGVELELDSRVMMELREGDKLRIETPGGGGYGSDAENKK